MHKMRSLLRRAPWKVRYEGAFAFIDLNNELPEMTAVLGYLANSGLSIRKAERQTASLEEIFMKVAGQE